MLTTNDRIANALFEAFRYKEAYAEKRHSVIFKGYSVHWGVLIETSQYDGSDIISLRLARNDGEDWNLEWKADISAKGLTFVEMIERVRAFIVDF